MTRLTRACSVPPREGPVAEAAGALLGAWTMGDAAGFRAALDGAARSCPRLPADDGGAAERRELLAAVIHELRAAPHPHAPDRVCASLLAHLAGAPPPALPYLM